MPAVYWDQDTSVRKGADGKPTDLSDVLVEELSIVDEPAIGSRFLVLKRKGGEVEDIASLDEDGNVVRKGIGDGGALSLDGGTKSALEQQLGAALGELTRATQALRRHGENDNPEDTLLPADVTRPLGRSVELLENDAKRTEASKSVYVTQDENGRFSISRVGEAAKSGDDDSDAGADDVAKLYGPAKREALQALGTALERLGGLTSAVRSATVSDESTGIPAPVAREMQEIRDLLASVTVRYAAPRHTQKGDVVPKESNAFLKEIADKLNQATNTAKGAADSGSASEVLGSLIKALEGIGVEIANAAAGADPSAAPGVGSLTISKSSGVRLTAKRKKEMAEDIDKAVNLLQNLAKLLPAIEVSKAAKADEEEEEKRGASKADEEEEQKRRSAKTDDEEEKGVSKSLDTEALASAISKAVAGAVSESSSQTQELVQKGLDAVADAMGQFGVAIREQGAKVSELQKARGLGGASSAGSAGGAPTRSDDGSTKVEKGAFRWATNLQAERRRQKRTQAQA